MTLTGIEPRTPWTGVGYPNYSTLKSEYLPTQVRTIGLIRPHFVNTVVPRRADIT